MATNSPRISSDLVVRWRLAQTRTQQGQHLAVFPAALAGVLVQDHVVEGIAQDGGLLADVLVAAVARAADDHRARLGRQRFDGGDQRAHGIGVVAVVGDRRWRRDSPSR
jgi:hypothetical protein